MKKIGSIVLSLLLTLCFCSCKDTKENKLSSTQVMMDTVVTVTIWDSDQETLNSAIALCKKYEQLFSRTVEGSDVSRINKAVENSNAESKEVLSATVSDETIEILKSAQDMSQKSDGAFDVTILPLVKLWNITNATKPPKEADIENAKLKVNFNSLQISGNEVSSRFAQIDLGGIAKGYIADKVCEYLKSKGVKKAIINLGGNVCVMGDENYSIGIQKPFDLHGESAAVLKLSNKTTVTSGIYERYFEYEGEIYHHIIDPKTGYPANNNVASVTVIADNSSIADCLSTACLILGVDDGMKLAYEYNAETVFITTDGEIIVSKGLNKTDGETPTITFE